MPPAISIVIIDSDPDSISNIQKHLKNIGDNISVEGVSQSFDRGYEIIHKKRPMVVILEVRSDDLDTYIERINLILSRFLQISIFATCNDKSSDTILKVMRAGATEYLLRPVNDVDLTAALQKLGRLWISKPDIYEETGRIYTLFSPKGGVGNTTIAINLAVNIFEATKEPTIVVDLDLNAGDVSTFLNLKPSYTISDVTTNIARLDKTFLQSVITKHDSGIYVLAEPQKIAESLSISSGDIKRVLSLLKVMFKNIIIDTEPTLNERILTAIEMSDIVFITFVISLPGIKNIKRYLNYLDSIGYKRDKIKLIANRYIKKGDIKIEDAEKILNYPIFWHLPNEYFTAMASINKGVPLNISEPKSKLNLAIKDLVNNIVTVKK